MLQYLARPFSYLTIRHSSFLPAMVNFVAPLLVAIAVFLASWLGNFKIQLFGDEGLISLSLGFVQTLTGFYLAALAAMATFSSASMDRPMPGETPVMKIIYNGHITEVNATRRRFLCSMFAYLTAVSFVITVASIFLVSTATGIKDLFSSPAITFIRNSLLVAYSFAIAQMTIITAWGLYYLGERVHIED